MTLVSEQPAGAASTVLVFEDIEIWLAAYLRSLLADVFVGRKVPTTRRDYMVTIRRVGGVTRNRVSETARIGVNVYAPDDAKANDLAAKVRAYVGATAGEGNVRQSTTTGFYEVEDSQPRRYFTAELVIKGKALNTQ